MPDLTTELARRLFSLLAPAGSPPAARDDGPPFTAALADANRSHDSARTARHDLSVTAQPSGQAGSSASFNDTQAKSLSDPDPASDANAANVVIHGPDTEQDQYPHEANPETVAAETAILAVTQPVIVAASQAPLLSELESAEQDGQTEGSQTGKARARINPPLGKKATVTGARSTSANDSEAAATTAAADPNAESIAATVDLPAELADKLSQLPKSEMLTERKVGDKLSRQAAQSAAEIEKLPQADSSHAQDAIPESSGTTAADAALVKPKSRTAANRTPTAIIPGESEMTDVIPLSAAYLLSQGRGQSGNPAAAIIAPEQSADAVSPVDQTPLNSPQSPANPSLPPASHGPAGGFSSNRGDAPLAPRGPARDGASSEIDRVRFVQRVARTIQNVQEGEGEIRLRLSPPELGALKLEVTLRDGALTARLEAETVAARNLLMENLPQLKERLAEQQVRIESFEVDVRDQPRGDDARQFADQAKEHAAQARNRVRPAAEATARGATATITRSVGLKGNSAQLNVIV